MRKEYPEHGVFLLNLFKEMEKNLKSLILKKVEWKDKSNKMTLNECDGPESEIVLKADLVLLAMGFLHPRKDKLIKDLGIELNDRGNVVANDIDYKTNLNKIFVSGDMRRGQSLVVWAIREGRQVAHSVDKFLMGKNNFTLLNLIFFN